MPTIDNKETLNMILLMTKCHFFESSVVQMQDGLFGLICDRLQESHQSPKRHQKIRDLAIASTSEKLLK